MKTRSLKFFMAVCFTFACIACAGTLSKNYGNFEPDKAITQVFETYQVNPDINYYISGSDVHPNAIMGLKKNYTLEESLWRKIEMTPKKLRDLVEGMQKRASETGLFLSGWSMRDTGGREIGVWYSALFATTSVKVEGNNRVTIYTPRQHIYIENEHKDK
jgi:hypothetical protein